MPGPRRRGSIALLLAGLTGLVATLCALALPFAPMSVNEPTVTWPRDPGRPEPTLLTLTAYRPLALDATFTCAAARQAQASAASPAGGVVLATTEPLFPETGTVGLVVTARDERVQVRAMGRLLVDEPLAADCSYTIIGTGTGVPAYQLATPDPLDPDAPDLSRFAGPDDAVLTVVRDGTELARASGPQLPSVDMLTTSATAVEPGGAAGDPRRRRRVHQQPHLPQARADRAAGRHAPRDGRAARLGGPRVPRSASDGAEVAAATPRVVDVVVPAVVLLLDARRARDGRRRLLRRDGAQRPRSPATSATTTSCTTRTSRRSRGSTTSSPGGRGSSETRPCCSGSSPLSSGCSPGWCCGGSSRKGRRASPTTILACAWPPPSCWRWCSSPGGCRRTWGCDRRRWCACAGRWSCTRCWSRTAEAPGPSPGWRSPSPASASQRTRRG